jgi:hypothetical protein
MRGRRGRGAGEGEESKALLMGHTASGPPFTSAPFPLYAFEREGSGGGPRPPRDGAAGTGHDRLGTNGAPRGRPQAGPRPPWDGPSEQVFHVYARVQCDITRYY